MIIPYLLAAMLSPGATQAAAGAESNRPGGTAADAPPQSLANLASYVSDADYPVEAIRREEQGTVRFRLHITPEGRVGRCVIVETSGSPSLDETTCRIMTERARFTPARDSNGAAIADQIESRIKWVLPEESVEFEPPPVRAVSLVDLATLARPQDYPIEARRQRREGVVDIAIVIAADGSVEQCVVGQSSGSPLLDDRTCALVRERARFTPARDASGAPTIDIVQTTIEWRLSRK
jgi:TonB family protein